MTSLLYTLPDAGQGGPAVAWALSVLVLRGGGGVLAAGIGIFSVVRDRVHLPVVTLAAYGAVGVVYFTIRFMLFPQLPMALFTLLAAVFVVATTYSAFKLVDSYLLESTCSERGWS